MLNQDEVETLGLAYKESLRDKSISSLITEMSILRKQLDVTRKNLSYSLGRASSQKLLKQKEIMQEKVLAVEMEIGRRLTAPHRESK